MSKATPIAGATDTSTPDQTPALDRAASAVKTETAPQVNVAKSIVKPPQDHKEELASMFGGPMGLQAYRASRFVIDGIENTIKAPAEKYHQAKDDFTRGVQDLYNKDYRNLASDAASTTSDIAGATTPGMSFVTDRAREFSEGARKGGDLVTPLVKTGVDVATAGAAEYLPKFLKNPYKAAAAAKQVISPSAEVAGESFATRPIRSGANVEAGTQAVQNIAEDTTKSTGATPTSKPTSLRDIFNEPVQAKTAVAQPFYDALDKASNNQWTANQKALVNVQRDIQMKGGINEDVDAALNARKLQLEWQQEQILDKVPKGTASAARDAWYAKSRLEDVQTIFNKKANVSGPRPEMAKPGVKGIPAEQYNWKGIAKDLNAMDPHDLQVALGSKETAQNLVTTANLAAKQGWATAKAIAAIKGVLQLVGASHGVGALTHLIP
jgi:hypothetical protein